MNLYIQIKNNQPFEHPAFEENLLQAFGTVPEHWESFVRVQCPVPTIYQNVDEEPTYQKINGVWTDNWNLRDMTAEEKLAKQQSIRDEFNSREQASNWSAWTLDESTCTMQPPIPRPDLIEGVLVFWCGADNAWKEAPARPEGNYKFDFFEWKWILIA
jgi:hypothetical protein